MNWGVLGCANIAVNSVIPAILRSNQKLIAVSSRSIDKARIVAKKFSCDYEKGYDNLVNRSDIDAVYIPLPNSLHFHWAKTALLSGKNVLIEKPAVTEYNQALELVKISKRMNLALVENFQFQTHSQNKWVINKLKINEIGELRNFRSTFCFPKFKNPKDIRYNKKLDGGALYDAGAYVVKAVSAILSGTLKVNSSVMSYNNEYGVDWFGSISGIEIKNQIPCQLSYGFDNYYQCNYEILGSKGKITALRAFTAKADHEPIILFEKNGLIEKIKLPSDDHFKNMIVNFETLVKEKKFEDNQREILNQALLLDMVRKNSIRI